MSSTAAKREALQVELQILRDQRQREAEEFDKLEREGNLGADEIAEVAARGAQSEGPTSLTVNEVEVKKGDYVSTVDDAGVLNKAEKGFLVSDPVKKIYLGEKGEVIRVFESFQGKSALELRFADGVCKVFFAECIVEFQTKDTNEKKTVGEPRKVPPPQKEIPKQTLEPVSEPLPSWNSIALPKREGKKMEAPKNREEGKEVSVEAPSAVPLAPAQPQPQSSPVELTDESSQIPKSCLPGYQAKFSIDDVASSIPRMNLGDKKSVAVALYTSGSKTPLQFKSIALYKKDLPSVLHVLSYIFRQECHNKPLTRIFTHNGVELKDGGNPTSHAQLVVTTGGDYEPLGASVSSGSASKKSPGVKAPTKKTPPSPSTGGPGKPIHIKVFENGLYGDDKFDRAYITVTIRPTYKTMTAVKSTITRELQWRDGRKVDALFDATGAEIEAVDQLTDGAAIVASAGDRFVVPFPNTALHREAMKLNATLS